MTASKISAAGEEDSSLPQTAGPRVPLPTRMDLQTDKSAGPDACWRWTGHLIRGYGRVRNDAGRKSKAHRVAWEMAHGARLIDPRLFVLHRCDNPSCVNPAHLWLGTHDENMADMVAKGRCRKNLSPDYVERTVKGLPESEYFREWRKARREARQ